MTTTAPRELPIFACRLEQIAEADGRIRPLAREALDLADSEGRLVLILTRPDMDDVDFRLARLNLQAENITGLLLRDTGRADLTAADHL